MALDSIWLVFTKILLKSNGTKWCSEIEHLSKDNVLRSPRGHRTTKNNSAEQFTIKDNFV